MCWLLEGGVCFLCLWPWDDLFLVVWGDGVRFRGVRDLDLLDWWPVWLGGVPCLLLDLWWWSLSCCLELVAACRLSFVSDLWVWVFLYVGFLLSVVLFPLPSSVFVGCCFLAVFWGDLGLCWFLGFIVSLLSLFFRVTFLMGVGSLSSSSLVVSVSVSLSGDVSDSSGRSVGPSWWRNLHVLPRLHSPLA